MFYWVKRKLHKNRTINKLWQKVWDLEMGLSIQDEFLQNARENKEKLLRQVQVEEEFLKELGNSHTYEDRQKKNRAEEQADRLGKILAQQEKEIGDGKNRSVANLERIDDLVQQIKHIKKNF